MKKVLATLLLATTVLNFTACSGASKETAKSDGAVISVQVEEKWLPYYEKVKERVLEKNPDAKINFIQSESFDHLDIMDNTDASNEDVADVFAAPIDRIFMLDEKNAIAPMDAKAMAEKVGGFKDYDEGLGGSLKKDGEYLAFPYNIEAVIGFANLENAKKIGIDMSNKIEFTSLGYEQLLARVHDAWFGVGFTNSVGLELLGKDSSGKLFSDMTKDYKDLTEDQKKLFEALFTYWKGHDQNKTDLWDKESAGGYVESKFETGQPNAILIDGPWAKTSLIEKAGSSENLKAFPLNQITVNGKELSHWKSGWSLAINSRIEMDKDKMDLATAFIEEIVNPKYAKDLFAATGKILENVEPSAYDGVDAGEKSIIDVTYASYNSAEKRPLFSEYSKVWDSWQNGLLSWSATQPQNGEEAYNAVKASFEAMMQNFNQ